MILPTEVTKTIIYKEVSQREIDFFDHKWIDTSIVQAIKLGKEIVNYEIENVQSRSIIEDSTQIPTVTIWFTQSRVKHNSEYKVDSLDVLLGLVGGFASIVAGAMQLILGDYEDFRFKNSLIRHTYRTVPQRDSDGIDGAKTAKNAIIKSVASKSKYWYSYYEYLYDSLIKLCCCCKCTKNRVCFKKRMRKLERHQDACEKLDKELDVVKFLKV